ncbi:MAG: hypothetical protein RSD49_06770 [Hafnia sp.]
MISNAEKAKALRCVANALEEYLSDDFLSSNQSGDSVNSFRELVCHYAGKRHNKEAIDAAIAAVAILIPGLDAPDHQAINQKSPE